MRGTRQPTQQTKKKTTYEAKEVELTEADAEEIEKARIALKTEVVIFEQTLNKAKELSDYIPAATIKTFCDARQDASDVEHFAGVLVTAGRNTQGVKSTVATLKSHTKKVTEQVKKLKNKMLQADKAKAKCTYTVPDAD